MGTGKSVAMSKKRVHHIYNSIFDLICLPWAVCVKSFVNQSNSLKDVALNVDTNKTQNLELLLDAADLAKFLAMEDFKHYELHKAVRCK